MWPVSVAYYYVEGVLVRQLTKKKKKGMIMCNSSDNNHSHHCETNVRPINVFFSYMPRSGSRVIAARNCQDIIILESYCGTYAAGDFVHISLSAAEPKRWWRNTACRLAEQVVASVGGLAEDDRGTVSIVFPAAYAAEIAKEVKSLACYHMMPEYGAEIDRQAWRQEAAVLAISDQGTVEYHYYHNRQIERIALEVVPGFARRNVRLSNEESQEMHGIEFKTVVYPAIWVCDRRLFDKPDSMDEVWPHIMVNDVSVQLPAVPVTAKGEEVTCHAPIGSRWGDGTLVSSHSSVLAWPENTPRPRWAGWNDDDEDDEETENKLLDVQNV